MPEAKSEIVRWVYDHWSDGDFQAGAELFDPLVLFILRPEFPDAGTYVGPARVADYMRGFLENIRGRADAFAAVGLSER